MTLKAGLVCVGNYDDTSYVFSIPEDITTTTISSGTGSKATFGSTDAPIKIYEGSFLISVVDFSAQGLFSKGTIYIC